MTMFALDTQEGWSIKRVNLDHAAICMEVDFAQPGEIEEIVAGLL